MESKVSDDELSALTTDRLQHLLRLSALPPSQSISDTQEKLSTLHSQLGFVKDVQSVDTKGVQTLQSLRDETIVASQETSVDIESVKHVLNSERLIGKHYKRLRTETRRPPIDSDSWDVLGHAERKVGNYFVVKSGNID